MTDSADPLPPRFLEISKSKNSASTCRYGKAEKTSVELWRNILNRFDIGDGSIDLPYVLIDLQYNKIKLCI
jgi:hypothetical protein